MSEPIIKPQSDSAHWYSRDGQPMHTVIGSSTGRPRPTNITDARKLGLLPSVTSITRILDKPALNKWRVEQGILAAMTTPRELGETDDVYIDRVFNVEKQHEQEAEKARNLGTDVHAAIEARLSGQPIADDMKIYVDAAYSELTKLDAFSFTETQSEFVIIGDGYAGRCDLRKKSPTQTLVVDFKTAKNLPKSAYPENAMQLAAYIATEDVIDFLFRHRFDRAKIRSIWSSMKAANIYISTTEPGKAVTIIHENLADAYEAFRNCLKLWKWINKF